MLDKFLKIYFLSIYLFPLNVLADLPLAIEDLLTYENRYRLELGVVFANKDNRNVNSYFDMVQIGAEQFIMLPVGIGEERRNTDFLALALGLRYGLTKKTEILSRMTAVAEEVRIRQDNIFFESHYNQRFSDIVFGINHQFSEDNDTPALLGFTELTMAENTATNELDLTYGKSLLLGFTTYRAIDPLVLSLTVGYRYAGKRDVDEFAVDPGDLLFINPSVGFAVNSQVTLTGGFQLRFRGKDEIDSEREGIRTSNIGLYFGLGYAFSKRLSLHVSTKANVSGDNSAEVGFNILYKFGDLPKINLNQLENK